MEKFDGGKVRDDDEVALMEARRLGRCISHGLKKIKEDMFPPVGQREKTVLPGRIPLEMGVALFVEPRLLACYAGTSVEG